MREMRRSNNRVMSTAEQTPLRKGSESTKSSNSSKVHRAIHLCKCVLFCSSLCNRSSPPCRSLLRKYIERRTALVADVHAAEEASDDEDRSTDGMIAVLRRQRESWLKRAPLEPLVTVVRFWRRNLGRKVCARFFAVERIERVVFSSENCA